MTDEELEKEVEEKSEAYIDTIIIYGDVGASKEDVLDAYKQGALDFAEPREKLLLSSCKTSRASSDGGIRMTDEEMAVKYVREHTGFNVKEPLGKIAVRTYLAGLTACRPKWHKVAEKLPPLWEGLERTSIRVVDNYDRIIIYDYESERWRDLEGDSLGIQPDYWCEIPQFKE